MAGLFKKSMSARMKLLSFFGFFVLAGMLSGHLFNRVQAAPGGPVAIASSLVTGDAYGFAWMGTGINNPSVSEGGGGWLNLNCKTSQCYDLNGNGSLDQSEQWGVTVDLDHSGIDGSFDGEAWSSNYGWMVFNGAGISNCWSSNPGATNNGPARADIASGGGWVDVHGWAKFVAGDDSSVDGWDGCVAFSGTNHSVKLNTTTGALSGWAWGGPIVGWISFQNPECQFCNPSVVLDNVPTLSFWADDYLIPSGTGTVLHWQATDSSTGNSVSVCPGYLNSSNYGHWNSSAIMPQAANVQEISLVEGNLPIGQHNINNITANTTYEIRCQDEFGVDLPIQYLTIVIEVPGCMDSTSPNYNPNANVDNGTCGGPGLPTITLNVITGGLPDNTLPEGSTNPVDYQVSPRWVFTNRDQFASSYCTQSFTDENGTTQNLNAWTGAQLSNPTLTGNNPFDPSGNSWVTTTNIAMYADDAPANPVSTFTFTITCQDLNGNPISATDTVIIVAVPDPISPSLALFVENPTLIIGSGNYSEKLWWTSDDPSNLSSCDGDFVRTSPSGNPTLTGWETGNLPEPNVAQNPGHVLHQASFTTLANGVTSPATYRFTLTCDDDLNPGETVSASQNVQFVNPIVSTEPPQLSLVILQPDNPPGTPGSEQIPATGYDNPAEQFTLKWQALNVNGCKAYSEQFNGANPAVIGSNPDWDYPQSVQDDGDPTDSVQVSKSFPIPLSDAKNTIFYIVDCIPDDPSFIVDPTNPELPPVHVCMSITGQIFPQCSVNGEPQIPSYVEI